MSDIRLHPTRCAICNTDDNATEVYPANFDIAAFNPTVFSARRLPDRIHYRMVRCDTCGLVRSDPRADHLVLARLYAQSTFDYSDEVANLKTTYGRYLAKLDEFGVRKGSLLEIGCGNGFFLQEALAQGYLDVRGVEPSESAIAQADERVRLGIVCDMMRPGLFSPDEFDVLCVFQTFDHVSDPGSFLNECLRVLKPGGLMLCLNHNVEAISARLLRERSPIIDIEHTYLYSPTTMRRIFVEHCFRVRHVGAVFNNYTLYYLARLVPMPAALKRVLLARLERAKIGRLRLSVPLGNLYLIAQKP